MNEKFSILHFIIIIVELIVIVLLITCGGVRLAENSDTIRNLEERIFFSQKAMAEADEIISELKKRQQRSAKTIKELRVTTERQREIITEITKTNTAGGKSIDRVGKAIDEIQGIVDELLAGGD